MSDVAVRVATPADDERVLAILDAGFAQDPFVGWVTAGDPRARRRYASLVLRRLVRPHGIVWIDQSERAAALWVKPRGWELTLWDQLKLLPSVARVVGWRRIGEMGRASECIERGRPPSYWYLALVATLPEARGRGLGRAVLAPALEASRRDGVPALLETSNPDNVAWYERLGFRVVREIDLAEVVGREAPPVWSMARE